ncbi:hypothetical protein [Deinococcus rufus]|uniref:Uncharacterized protein n=1 Tax=Deinococcus rufus TaxID=2136097 RepID=A0ABV7Z8S2_9DEIO
MTGDTGRPALEFVVQVPPRFQPVLDAYDRRVHLALGQALAVAFGLPFPTPVQVRVCSGSHAGLVAFGGNARRVPDPMEVDGWISGVLIAAAVPSPARIRRPAAPGASP